MKRDRPRSSRMRYPHHESPSQTRRGARMRTLNETRPCYVVRPERLLKISRRRVFVANIRRRCTILAAVIVVIEYLYEARTCHRKRNERLACISFTPLRRLGACREPHERETGCIAHCQSGGYSRLVRLRPAYNLLRFLYLLRPRDALRSAGSQSRLAVLSRHGVTYGFAARRRSGTHVRDAAHGVPHTTTDWSHTRARARGRKREPPRDCLRADALRSVSETCAWRSRRRLRITREELLPDSRERRLPHDRHAERREYIFECAAATWRARYTYRDDSRDGTTAERAISERIYPFFFCFSADNVVGLRTSRKRGEICDVLILCNHSEWIKLASGNNRLLRTKARQPIRVDKHVLFKFSD